MSSIILAAAISVLALDAASAAAPIAGAPIPPASRQAASAAPTNPAHDVASAREPRKANRRRSEPSFANDPGSSADCYYVFGDLRCDRIPNPGGARR